ncbi:MAG: hypothetical protein QME81_01945 [bacterium]|nr:hypothetical protein [bacterium]
MSRFIQISLLVGGLLLIGFLMGTVFPVRDSLAQRGQDSLVTMSGNYITAINRSKIILLKITEDEKLKVLDIKDW